MFAPEASLGPCRSGSRTRTRGTRPICVASSVCLVNYATFRVLTSRSQPGTLPMVETHACPPTFVPHRISIAQRCMIPSAEAGKETCNQEFVTSEYTRHNQSYHNCFKRNRESCCSMRNATEISSRRDAGDINKLTTAGNTDCASNPKNQNDILCLKIQE